MEMQQLTPRTDIPANELRRFALHPDPEHGHGFLHLLNKYGLHITQVIRWQDGVGLDPDKYIHLYPRDDYTDWRAEFATQLAE
jgi:hypothetical protein